MKRLTGKPMTTCQAGKVITVAVSNNCPQIHFTFKQRLLSVLFAKRNEWSKVRYLRFRES